MTYNLLVTIIGQITDESEANSLAEALEQGVTQAHKHGCIVDIWDARLGRYLHRKVVHPSSEGIH